MAGNPQKPVWDNFCNTHYLLCGWYFLDPQNGNFYMKYSWNIFYPYGTYYRHNRETVGQKRVQHLHTSRTAVGRNVDGLISGHGSDLEMKGYIVGKNMAPKHTVLFKNLCAYAVLKFETMISFFVPWKNYGYVRRQKRNQIRIHQSMQETIRETHATEATKSNTYQQNA